MDCDTIWTTSLAPTAGKHMSTETQTDSTRSKACIVRVVDDKEGIYVLERSIRETLKSCCQIGLMVWLGWGMLPMDGVGLLILVVAKPQSWPDKPTVASELHFCLLYAPKRPFSRLFASSATS